jgi:phosphorylated adapter RNA export protein
MNSNDDSAQKTTAADIARQLEETNPVAIAQIERVVQHLGADAALALLQETLEVEAGGGTWLPDGSRRRTPGGVFFQLVKGRAPHEVRSLIWPQPKKKKKRPKGEKKQIEPLPW